MPRLQKALLCGIAFLVLLATFGQISAHQAQRRIERQLREYVLAQNISGFDLSGPVPPSKIEVQSEVSYPFIVVASFAVPRDLHVSYYQTSYLVLPWGFYEFSKRAIHPL